MTRSRKVHLYHIIKIGNYIPVVHDYLSNANISFSKNQKYLQKKNQVFLDFFNDNILFIIKNYNYLL